jgi:hypothetical protein
MAEPMLTAAQVQAMRERAEASITDTAAGAYLGWNAVPVLCTQDAAWRALVGEIVRCAVPYLDAWEALATVEAERGEHEALAHRWLAAVRAAQAALDGTA